MNNKHTNTYPRNPHLRVVHVQESHLERKIKERIQFLENQKITEKIKEFKGESPVHLYNKSIAQRQDELRWVLGKVS